MKRAAVLQSSYIPWRGYFDLLASVDTFIIYDDVQFTHSDWRNRNRIRTSNGLKWLTIPVPQKNRIRRQIRETEAAHPDWGIQHWRKIAENYRSAPHFEEISAWLEPIYSAGMTNLSETNFTFISAINEYLGIKTSLRWSWEFGSRTGKTERLVDLCSVVGADVYVSGPAAQNYLDDKPFKEANIAVEWFSYDGLLPYPQIHGGYEPEVSIIDLIMNCGPSAKQHLPSLAASV